MKKNLSLAFLLIFSLFFLSGCMPNQVPVETEIPESEEFVEPESTLIPIQPLSNTQSTTPQESVDEAINSLDSTMNEMNTLEFEGIDPLE